MRVHWFLLLPAISRSCKTDSGSNELDSISQSSVDRILLRIYVDEVLLFYKSVPYFDRNDCYTILFNFILVDVII